MGSFSTANLRSRIYFKKKSVFIFREDYQMINKIFALLTFLIVGLFTVVSGTFAEEISQTNNADIQNNVDMSANTGDNSVSSNNADANITTGSIDSTSSINNENINTNFAENEGCGSCTDE